MTAEMWELIPPLDEQTVERLRALLAPDAPMAGHPKATGHQHSTSDPILPGRGEDL